MEFSGTTFVISKTYKKHNIVISINEQQMLSKPKKKKKTEEKIIQSYESKTFMDMFTLKLNLRNLRMF